MAAVFGLTAATADAASIFVVDAPNDGVGVRRAPKAGDGVIWPATVSQTFDLSTDGDSAASLSGTLEVTAIPSWFETNTQSQNFNDDYAGDLNGSGKSAIWTASGYAPRASVDVYITWVSQSNYATGPWWTINGGVYGQFSQRVAPASDLVLDDPAGGTEAFQFLGTARASAWGQVQVTVGAGSGYTHIDAVAFKSDLLPGPAWPYPTPDGQVRLMSWNIEFFNTRTPPRTAEQLDLLAQRIAGFDAGVMALQEIWELSVLRDIAAKLGPTWKVISTSGQRNAILYDESKVILVSGGTLTKLSVPPYTSHPGKAVGDRPVTGVFKPVGGGDPFRVIGVHCHPSDSANRVAEGQWLHDQTAAFLNTIGEPKDIFVLGDYNEQPGGAVFTTLLQDDVLNLLPNENGIGTYVGTYSDIDHCSVTQGGLDRLPKPSSFVVRSWDYGESPEDFQATYSDHYPIVVDLNVPEPATMSLLVLGGLAVIRRDIRRRRPGQGHGRTQRKQTSWEYS
jgi:endonuclease/exonuclease/phosphatase family metal-dependent hydrolase